MSTTVGAKSADHVETDPLTDVEDKSELTTVNASGAAYTKVTKDNPWIETMLRSQEAVIEDRTKE